MLAALDGFDLVPIDGLAEERALSFGQNAERVGPKLVDRFAEGRLVAQGYEVDGATTAPATAPLELDA